MTQQWKEDTLSSLLRRSTLERSRGLAIRLPLVCLPCELHVNVEYISNENDPDSLASARRVYSSRAKSLWDPS